MPSCTAEDSPKERWTWWFCSWWTTTAICSKWVLWLVSLPVYVCMSTVIMSWSLQETLVTVLIQWLSFFAEILIVARLLKHLQKKKQDCNHNVWQPQTRDTQLVYYSCININIGSKPHVAICSFVPDPCFIAQDVQWQDNEHCERKGSKHDSRFAVFPYLFTSYILLFELLYVWPLW